MSAVLQGRGEVSNQSFEHRLFQERRKEAERMAREREELRRQQEQLRYEQEKRNNLKRGRELEHGCVNRFFSLSSLVAV